MDHYPHKRDRTNQFRSKLLYWYVRLFFSEFLYNLHQIFRLVICLDEKSVKCYQKKFETIVVGCIIFYFSHPNE